MRLFRLYHCFSELPPDTRTLLFLFRPRFRVEVFGYTGRLVLFLLHISGLAPDPRYPSSQQAGITSEQDLHAHMSLGGDVKTKAAVIEDRVHLSPKLRHPHPATLPTPLKKKAM